MALCLKDLPDTANYNAQGDDLGEERQLDEPHRRQQQQKLLEDLVVSGAMEKSSTGYYSLVPRALVDLKPWLVSRYHDSSTLGDPWQRIKDCVICGDIVTIGHRCGNTDCSIRVHQVCEDILWAESKPLECPGCHWIWTEAYVGEKALLSRPSSSE